MEAFYLPVTVACVGGGVVVADVVGLTEGFGGPSEFRTVVRPDARGLPEDSKDALLVGGGNGGGGAVGEERQDAKLAVAADGGKDVVFGTCGWAKVGYQVQGPSATWPSWEWEELAHPASVRSPSAQLALEAALDVLDAVLLQGGPVVAGCQEVEQFFPGYMLVLEVDFLKQE